MEKFQILIYVLIGVIWFIIRGFSKAREEATNTSTPPISQNIPFPLNKKANKTTTLEGRSKDMGRTIQQQVGQKREQLGQKATTIRTKAEERTPASRQGKASSGYTSSYEKAPTYDQQVGQEYVPVYTNEANEVDYEDPTKAQYKGLDNNQKQFEPFEQRTKPKNAVAQLLRNPSNVKAAFILSEIFNRKY